jgi:lactoylglutathione lyase
MRKALMLFLLAPCTLPAQEKLIGGISHVALRVSDLEKTRAFYARHYGIQQAYDQKDASGKTTLAVLKINDQQFLEFSQGSPVGFSHVAFLTDKLERLHELTQTLGLNPPDLRTGRDRTRNFTLRESDKLRVEFVRYEPDSLQAQSRGKFPNRVNGLSHISLPVDDQPAATAFLRKLGFVENTPLHLSPPGERDYIELLPASSSMHLAFEVGDDSPPSPGVDPDGIHVDLLGLR